MGGSLLIWERFCLLPSCRTWSSWRRWNPPRFLKKVVGSKTRDRCYDFSNIFAEKFGEKRRFLPKTKLNYSKFWEKRQFFRRKSQKIVIITSTPALRRFFNFVFGTISGLVCAAQNFYTNIECTYKPVKECTSKKYLISVTSVKRMQCKF
jgi:hypothetical protein